MCGGDRSEWGSCKLHETKTACDIFLLPHVSFGVDLEALLFDIHGIGLSSSQFSAISIVHDEFTFPWTMIRSSSSKFVLFLVLLMAMNIFGASSLTP
jgi:hypothetical protein